MLLSCVLLVSIPSVRTMIALRPPDRCESWRAVAAVASYKDVVPNGRKSERLVCRLPMSGVNPRRSWDDESNVNTAASSSNGRSCARSASNARRAMSIFGPTLMLPLMSTRKATVSGERSSEPTDNTGRSSPLSRTSKSSAVSLGTARPRLSRTDAWIVTTSTALRNNCAGASGDWPDPPPSRRAFASSDSAAVPMTTSARTMWRKIFNVGICGPVVPDAASASKHDADSTAFCVDVTTQRRASESVRKSHQSPSR